MKIRVAIAVSAMLAATQSPAAEPTRDARFTWDLWCAPCHAAGPGHPGTQALAAKYADKLPAELERRTDLKADDVKYYVRNGISVMPFFRKSEITAAELDALAEYLSPQAARKRIGAGR